jgi:hypothetical protein
MEEYFQERQIKSNVKKLKEVFNIISLTRKYKVIGSSSLKNIRYNSDFDLADFYENSKPSIKKIVKYFQYIYRTLDSKRSYSYITDFKCGVNDEGQPLKWTKEEVKNNFTPFRIAQNSLRAKENSTINQKKEIPKDEI